MQRHQDKARSNVLDYNTDHQPESQRERRLFGATIGAFLFLILVFFYYRHDYYEAYRLLNSMQPMPYKIGLAAAYLTVPVTCGLAIVGLYNRTNFGYWLTGFSCGVLLLMLSTFVYGAVVNLGLEVFSMPGLILLEFGFPLLLTFYFLYFLTRPQIMSRYSAHNLTLLFSILCGYVFSGLIMALILS